jgi:uncharacterized protein (DUF433 family)
MGDAPALLNRREAATIGGFSLAVVDKAIEQRVVKPTRRTGQPLLPDHEVALLVLLREIDTTLPRKSKLRLRGWLAHSRPKTAGAEFALSAALHVAMTKDAVRTFERAENYARLRDVYVEHNPAVMGGEPVIAGTRVPVRTIASLLDMGETHETLSEDYPQVPREAYEIARLWAQANPRRGRPARPWETTALRTAVKHRAARVA